MINGNLQNAINKAKKVKCFAKHIGNRRYLVVTPQNHRYTVRMEMHDGLRYAICNCAAGSKNMACYHIVGAAALDTALTGYVQPTTLKQAA
jgi:hypothetical protein